MYKISCKRFSLLEEGEDATYYLKTSQLIVKDAILCFGAGYIVVYREKEVYRRVISLEQADSLHKLLLDGGLIVDLLKTGRYSEILELI